MNDPATVQEWFDVARERGEDATSMLSDRVTSIGPVYMVGYAVESALKAYLHRKGIPRPATGQSGHDLRALWKATRFRLSDIKDNSGCATYFIETWTTALRYQAYLPDGTPDSGALVRAALRLVGFITCQTKRTR